MYSEVSDERASKVPRSTSRGEGTKEVRYIVMSDIGEGRRKMTM